MSLNQFRFSRSMALIWLSAILLFGPSTSLARPEGDLPDEEIIQPDGIHVLDGSFVLDVGELHINITNHGLIGSQFTDNLPYSSSPSGEWPGGSGHEYLWGAGLWVGAKVNGQAAVSTGQPERELRPGNDLLDTIYESKDFKITRPWANDEITGRRLPDYWADDDDDGTYDEDMLNGYDDDGDGLIDEDYGQFGDQMFTCTMHDNTLLSREIYPEHIPLNVTVVQRAATWYREELDDIVVFDFEIHNNGFRTLNDVYLGFYVDCDIQRRDDTGTGHDDLGGYYSGALRSSDGAFQRVNVAWMRDADTIDPLPGWMGTILLGHDTDFTGHDAPRHLEVRSYQIFATHAQVDQNGEPKTDDDRYRLMSLDQKDPDRRPDQPGDLKYMISSGPFNRVDPGEKLSYRLAMVMGNSKAEMLENAVKATELGRGSWFDLDKNWTTGRGGREHKVCIGDLVKSPGDPDPIFSYRADMPDPVCSGTHPRLFVPYIQSFDMFSEADGSRCIYINADDCESCFHATGVDCVWGDGLYDTYARNFRRDLYPNARLYTGTWGREAHLPWVTNEERPPPPPNMRLVPGQFHVDVYWDNKSELEPDFLRGIYDFESYQIWRVHNWQRPRGTEADLPPRTDEWAMIQEYDIANFIPAGVGVSPNRLPLGLNTGLEVVSYSPVCLEDSTFAGLAEVTQEFVDADTEGQFITRPPLRDSKGVVIPGREAFIPWESWPTVLDTFFAVASREGSEEIFPKRATTYYRHRDTEVHVGFPAYYSVVASDHQTANVDGEWIPVGLGIASEPGNNFQKTIPVPPGQTTESRDRTGTNIYVFPNPATREALAQFQQQPPSGEDPTGERIMFNNLPAAQNKITIFTASGDIVQTIDHDGINDGGGISWNLMSRNGQEVVSGIYLYTVRSEDDRFEDFQGRFVLVR